MVIRELKPSQRVQGQWLAVLEDDSVLRLGEQEMIDFALYAGKELSEEETEKLLDSLRQSGFREKALRLLGRRPLSRREVERRLEEWGASQEEVSAICDRLEELNFLDDGRYARQVIRHYAARGYGVRKLRDELYRRGIPRQLWDEAMEEAETAASAIDTFLEKKLRGSREPKDLKKASDALARRGYTWSEIHEALRRYGAEPEEP